MKILRVYSNGAGIFTDGLRSVDGAANRAEFEFHQHGILVRREGHKSILVPFTNVAWLMVEEDPKPVKKIA